MIRSLLFAVSSGPRVFKVVSCSILKYPMCLLKHYFFSLIVLIFAGINNDIAWMCSTIIRFFSMQLISWPFCQSQIGKEKLMVTKANKYTQKKLSNSRLGRNGLNQPGKLFSVYDRRIQLHIKYRYFSHIKDFSLIFYSLKNKLHWGNINKFKPIFTGLVNNSAIVN